MSDAILDPILSQYSFEAPGTLGKLRQILGHGALGGTGRMLIYPVDQGVEHGPARSFHINPDAYDPLYHWRLAIDAGANALAAPLGLMEAGAAQFAGQIPTILKVNNSNSHATQVEQGLTASVQDALRLGCAAIGFTLYPGCEADFKMQAQLRDITAQAKAAGLATVVWSYPRGGKLSKAGETGLDVIGHAAQIAAQLGANIIKIKPPSDHIEQPEAQATLGAQDWSQLSDRIAHIREAAFAGRRLVVFSGGAAKDKGALLDEVRAIAHGGGNGSIVGRNAFQRPRAEALALMADMIEIYRQAAQEPCEGAVIAPLPDAA